MKYKVLTLSEAEEWNRLLAKLPIEQQDIYYTPEYYSLYQNYGDGEAYCFVFEYNGDIALYPFLLNSVNKLGYTLDKEYYDIQGAYGYNGVVSSTYDSVFVEEFYKEFHKYCILNNIIAEFTRSNPLVRNNTFSEKNLELSYNRQIVVVDLEGCSTLNYLQQLYTKQGRKDVRKAYRHNFTIRVAKSEDDYLIFYRIYKERMKEIGSDSYYHFNLNFFKNICSFIDSNQRLFIVSDEKGRVAGGMIYFFIGDYAHNFLSASKRDFFNYNINDLLQDVVIKDAIKMGVKTINLGGGNSSHIDDNLLSFKKKFSKNTLDFYIARKVYNPEIYKKVVVQWEEKHPDKVEKYRNHLLKYRY